jgi:probable HAF family extracellular repeat protein
MRRIAYLVVAVACCGVIVQAATGASRNLTERPNATQASVGDVAYQVSDLPSLGGTSSRGNSINNLGLVTGFSNTSEGPRHAAAWLFDSVLDLNVVGGTLGGPDSDVPWPVKNTLGIISGIAQTATPEPNGEQWSCGYFFGGPDAFKYTCHAVVWELGHIRDLPLLPGGNNSFATGTNNLRQTVGWSENGVHDPTCDPLSHQVLQFRAVVWGPRKSKPRKLPLIADDTSSAATAINDEGQIVGISGTCDQAVGRYTAKHAVLWDRNGSVSDLGNIGAHLWNTPMAINQTGDVVGFAGTDDSDLAGDFTHAFVKLKGEQMIDIGTLPADDTHPTPDTSSVATAINASRQVVGYSCGDSGCRPFLWQDGMMHGIVAPGYPNVLELAMDINDFGVITGRALNPTTNEHVAFVAKPVG